MKKTRTTCAKIYANVKKISLDGKKKETQHDNDTMVQQQQQQQAKRKKKKKKNDYAMMRCLEEGCPANYNINNHRKVL